MTMHDINKTLSQIERLSRKGKLRRNWGSLPRRRDREDVDDKRVALLKRALSDAQKRLEDMTKLAYVDGLSSLGNRRAFDDELRRAEDRAARYGTPSAISMFDIDDFKGINDAFGHEAGDSVILALAQTLRSNIRASDFAARIGGDEFAIIFSNISFEDALQKTENLRQTLMRIEYKFSGQPFRASVSIGTSQIGANQGDHPLRVADQAMYRQKKTYRTIYSVL